MKQKNEGPRKWHLRNAKALEIFQPWGPTVSVYTYVKGFLMEEEEDLFQMSPKVIPIVGCYLISSTYGVRVGELSVKLIWYRQIEWSSVV